MRHPQNARIAILLLIASLTLGGCNSRHASEPDATVPPAHADATVSPESPPIVERTFEQRLGTRFQPVAGGDGLELAIDRIPIPDFPGTFAIWGASGRDDAGNVLLGVSTVWTKDASRPSARLFVFDPTTETLSPAGDVMNSLDRLDLAREATLPLKAGRIAADAKQGEPTLCRESQMKIHTKFITMDDGWTYFASMDEWNEREDGSQLPYWGSHFWRCRVGDDQWQHLKSVPEGVIALSGVGRYLFGLGYFGHVVYRYDTSSGDWKRREIGSYKGHISRNVVSDARGHVFVPRLTTPQSDGAAADTIVELVELNADLEEIQATPLLHYPVTGNASSHGLVGFANLRDGSIAITTSIGYLYRLVPSDSGPTQVAPVGWFHPDGESYASSLVPLDGDRYLGGVTKRKGSSFEWVVYDLEQDVAQKFEVEITDVPEHGMKSVLLYGSNTRDDHGNLYLVGGYKTADGSRHLPLCLRVGLLNPDGENGE